MICYGLVDWLIRYPMTAVVTVVFTSCPTRGGQQRKGFKRQAASVVSLGNYVGCLYDYQCIFACRLIRDIPHRLLIFAIVLGVIFNDYQ